MSQNTGGIRRTQPITDALYGRKQHRKPKPESRRPANPRHGFSIATQLDAETLRKLGFTPDGRSPRRRPKVGA